MVLQTGTTYKFSTTLIVPSYFSLYFEKTVVIRLSQKKLLAFVRMWRRFELLDHRELNSSLQLTV